MVEVRDLRKLPIEELTKQELSSRLHIISDEIHRQELELLSNSRMFTALRFELAERNKS